MGLSLNWILFNGFKNSNFVQEQKLRYLSRQYLTKQLEIQTEASMYSFYQNYTKNKEIYELERQNIELAKSLAAIALERYKVGKTSILETKEIQRNYEDSQIRFLNAQYEVKKSEIELLKVSNQLIKRTP
jgi:outer membrane protein